MKVTEAISRAAKWWNELGRGGVPLHFNRLDETRTSTSKRGPMIRVKDVKRDLPSGILNGAAWEDLTKEEKLMVVKAWHHHFIRRPQMMAAAPEGSA